MVVLGSCALANKTRRFASVLYTPEGQKLIDKVWNETLAELSFANVEAIVRGMRSQ